MPPTIDRAITQKGNLGLSSYALEVLGWESGRQRGGNEMEGFGVP